MAVGEAPKDHPISIARAKELLAGDLGAVHRDILLEIAGSDPPGGVLEMVEVLERAKHRRLAADLGDTGVQAGLARRLEIDELVDQQARHDRAADAVKGMLPLLPAFDRLAMLAPEIGRQSE